MPSPSNSHSSSSNSSDRDDDGGGGGNGRSWAAAERVVSYLRNHKSVHAVCEKLGVDTKAFTPIPAGDRRACSPPPAGSICVYADALEAGMRVPLDPFFCELLSHFGVAPSQLAPNCWRIMAAFLALSRSAGVHPPSVPVFLHFFALRVLKVKGLYCFAPKDTAGIDPSTYSMMQNMRAEKAAAEAAEAAKVAAKSEPGCSASPGWTPLSGKKRPAEDNTREATGHGSASVPPGFSTRQKRKLQHAPDRHDGDTVEWEAARQLLQGVITPARERAFLMADPFSVIATSYIATLQVRF